MDYKRRVKPVRRRRAGSIKSLPLTRYDLLRQGRDLPRHGQHGAPRGAECLRVPPSLAATGSQEIEPVSGALASIDAITGINRADTANENQCGPAKSDDQFRRLLAARDSNPSTHLADEAMTVELNLKFPGAWSPVPWLQTVSGANSQRCQLFRQSPPNAQNFAHGCNLYACRV